MSNVMKFFVICGLRWKFDRKMNEILNRTDVDQENVFSDEQCDEILCDMWSKMKYYREQVTSGKFKKRDRSDVLIEFEARIESRELRQFEFCVLARKMLEFIIYDIGGDNWREKCLSLSYMI